MSKRIGLAWLAAAWIILGAASLLPNGLGATSWASNDPVFDGANIGNVRVTVLKDDMASIVVYPTSLTISDLDGSDTFAPDAVAAEGPDAAIIEVRIAASSDDAEEAAGGRVSLSSSDLELVYDRSNQTVGMRFNGIAIPPGAAIVNAYLQFQVDETTSEATSLTIRGQDVDNAATFSSASGDISSRPRTAATVSWSPVPWLTVGEAGLDQRSPNIASVIQEIVDRPGWSSGNSLAIIVTGTGKRVAESYNGDQNGAPLLHVEYSVGQPPVVTISTPLDGASFDAGEVITFSGSAVDAEDGDLTASLSWVSSLDGTIGTGGSFTRSDLSAGAHTITASVTDSSGLTGMDAITIGVYDIVVLPTSLAIDEPSGSDSFTLSLSSQPEDTVSVPLAASNGQCTVSPNSVDLDAANWANGVAATVTAVDDSIIDGPQICTILTGPASGNDANYAGLDPDDVTVTVNDDDTPGIAVAPKSLTIDEPAGSDSFVLTLNSQPADTVSVPLAASNGQCTVSPTSADLDAANWANGVAVTVTAVDDSIIDGPQACTILTGPSTSNDAYYDGLDPDDVTVTVNDDDTPGIAVAPKSLTIGEPSGSDSFVLTLNSQPADTVSVPLAASNGQCTVSPNSVDLDAANWANGVSATVTAVDDDIMDGPQICTILTGPATSDDSDYAGLDPDDVTVTVNDDDRPSITVAPKSLTISEPSGSDSFTLTLSKQPADTVSVPLAASNGQCTVSPTSLDLDAANWASGVSATVTAVDDSIQDGTQTCWILTGPATSSDAKYDGLDPDDVTVTVHDNDTPGIVVFPVHLTVQEPSGLDSFTLVLNSIPLDPVSVPLSASNSECTVAPASVELHAANWNTGVVATVTAVDDDLKDGTQTCRISTGAATSDDPAYHGLNPSDVMVSVEDDDAVHQVYLPLIVRTWPPIPGAPTLDPVSNADGDGTYAVSWSTAPRAVDYVLEESIDGFLSDAREIYSGISTGHSVTQRGAARYYYRVKARNPWGDSGWSAVEQVDVLWELEPNDQALSQANGPVSSGLTYYGTFPSGADEQDYYFFDLSSAHSIELWLRNIPLGQNYDLVLRDASLNQVGYSAKPNNEDEHILTGIVPAGRYYIQAYQFSSGGSGQAYHLAVAYE